MVLTTSERAKLLQLCGEFSEKLMELGASSSLVMACASAEGGGTGDCYTLRGSDYEVRDALRRRLEYMDTEVSMQISMEIDERFNQEDDDEY
jgi:hypothetical protein